MIEGQKQKPVEHAVIDVVLIPLNRQQLHEYFQRLQTVDPYTYNCSSDREVSSIHGCREAA
jgi:hypothetical protein